MANELTIGQLARASGVNVETIRYYQRRGLLDEPDKPLSGIRRYPDAVVKRVSFIKRAQALGFTLDEISSILQLEGADCCTETRELAARKLEVIKAKLASLTAMHDALAGLVKQCDAGRRRGGCPIIDALVQE